MDMPKTYVLYPIGRVVTVKKQKTIKLESRFVRGLKELDKFSHIHIFWHNPDNAFICNDIIGKNRINLSVAGILEINKEIIVLDSADIPDNSEILDIKAWMPMEDMLNTDAPDFIRTSPVRKGAAAADGGCGNGKSGISPLAVSEVGKIGNKEGNSFVQIIPEFSSALKRLERCGYVYLIWFFNRSDIPALRKTLVCNPPYNAPRTGVFASRAPVRPNPLALSLCRIESIDKDSLIINIDRSDAFNGSPLIAIVPYEYKADMANIVKVPEWQAHWPKWRQESRKGAAPNQIRPAEYRVLQYLSGDNVSNADNHPRQDDVQSADPGQRINKDSIRIAGARQNNLNNINVEIPLNKMTVITGVSGSGKSSLAFDTVFAESQRRFMQSLSVSSGINAGRLEKPDFDDIRNLPPSVAIDQKNMHRNPRSTVGSVSEVYSYLRLLYSRLGSRHCPECGMEIAPQSVDGLGNTISALLPGTEIEFFPGRKNSRKKSSGSVIIPKKKDELTALGTKIRELVSVCYAEGSGFLTLLINGEEKICVTDRNACTECNSIFFKLSPSVFSYNSPQGMCDTCKGLGHVMEVCEDKIITNPDKSLLDGASPWYGELRKYREKPNANWFRNEVLALADAMKVDLEIPWKNLPDDFRKKAMFGTGKEMLTYQYDSGRTGRAGTITRPVIGAVNNITRLFANSKAQNSMETYKYFLSEKPCPDCNGERLGREGRFVCLAGKRYPEAAAMTIGEIHNWLNVLPGSISSRMFPTAKSLTDELKTHLKAMIDMGIYYLGLDRPVTTLSGGESQKIKLAAQLSSGLSGLLYVLDEPSNGLHPHDHENMIKIMKKIRDDGNTVLVVEHDGDTINAADNIIDIGPGAGINGGNIIAQGPPHEIIKNPLSVTGPYLKNKGRQDKPKTGSFVKFIRIRGATLHNLKNIDVDIPVGTISCVTGVSGSGKSSLVRETLVPALKRKLNGFDVVGTSCSGISGLENFDRLVDIDQSSIGRSIRSIPATYIGVFDEIRDLFAETEEALRKKYNSSRFSFNDKAGRCPGCEGAGKIKLEMMFLPDAWITCADCEGKRYNRDTLEIRYRNKSIADVLDMDINEAVSLFEGEDKILRYLNIMAEIGLEYLRLGQSSASLSGGEAQRIKLARELVKNEGGRNLYILDEPTSGLHFADIARLLHILRKLTAHGNTVIIIEHNLTVISAADWIIDLGPYGGAEGGQLIAQGPLAEICRNGKSLTGKCLKKKDA